MGVLFFFNRKNQIVWIPFSRAVGGIRSSNQTGCERRKRRTRRATRGRSPSTPDKSTGEPLGADGRTGTDGGTEQGPGSGSLGASRHNMVMSSEEREGFWQAGCRSLQPACQKATADNGALSAVPNAATCPKAGATGRTPAADHAGRRTRRAGDQIGPHPFLGWLGGYQNQTRPSP